MGGNLKEELHIPVTTLRAHPEDAKAIHDLAMSHKLVDMSATGAGKKGFLLFVPDVKEYARRILVSNHTFVANDGQLAGFLTAFDPRERELLGREDDLAVSAIRNHLGGRSDFIFMDQIAVASGQSKSGIAQLLLDREFETHPDGIFGGAIVESPIANEVSRDFFERRNGLVRIAEVTVNEVTRGIYLIDRGRTQS